MLTIQLPNGKTAELSVNRDLVLRTPKKTIIVQYLSEKEKDERHKSKVTTISLREEEYYDVSTRLSEYTKSEAFMTVLQNLERDLQPVRSTELIRCDFDRTEW